MEILKEINIIKQNIPYFLEMQKSKENRGYFKYSLSGDLWTDNRMWNVGSAVFALKIAYTIGMDVDEPIVRDALKYVMAFQKENGYIYDSTIYRKAQLKNIINQARKFKFTDVSNQAYIRAESRQAMSSLLMYGKLPEKFPDNELLCREEMEAFFSKMDWEYPWAAGSHVSHTLFFFRLAYEKGIISTEEYESNICYAKEWIEKIHDVASGSWFVGNVSEQQKINGAMKILTGFRAVETQILNEETGRKLIDLCLRNVNNQQACDNFNIVYVLRYAMLAAPNYRKQEIIEFVEKRFRIYLEYYYPEFGGFSFYKGRSNSYYYNCKITKGKKEPDIHGTTLFMWGIAIICKILDIDEEVGLQEFIT